MHRVKFFGLLLILSLLLKVSMAFAQDNAAGPTKIYSLGEVVITDQKTASQVNTTLEINSDDMEKKNIKTLDQALELLPGVDVSVGGAGTPRINIRGFRSRHTILLLNGIPINSTWDQQFDPHLIPTENISKIKVSYGTHSALYGQGGMAGVINIITKQGTEGVNLDLASTVDEQGNFYSKGHVSGGNEKADFFISASHKNYDGFRLSDDFKATGLEDGGSRENSDDKRISLFGNLGYKVNDDMQLGLTFETSEGEYGVPTIVISDKNDPFYQKSKIKYERVEDFETFSTQASLSYAPGGVFSLRGWLFTNAQEQRYARYDNNKFNSMAKKGAYIDDTRSTVQGGTLQTRFDFDSAGELVLSFSGQEDDYSSDLYKVKKDGKAPEYTHGDHGLNLYSAAFEYRRNLLSTLDLVAGLSHHWQQKNEGSDTDKSSYMIGASFQATQTTTFRASYAKKIRFPSIRQLYDAGSGNTSLKPEESGNYEAGIAQKLPWDMTVDVSVFLNDVENYIEKDDSTSLYENNETYQFKGFEARLTKSILKNGQIGVSYSMLKTKDKSENAQRDELQNRPKFKFVIDASYTFDFGLTASADYTLTGEQYFYNSKYEKGTLPEYSIVNLRLEQKLYKDTLSIYIGADNLLDEDYQESYGYPRPGRTAYAGVRLRF